MQSNNWGGGGSQSYHDVTFHEQFVNISINLDSVCQTVVTRVSTHLHAQSVLSSNYVTCKLVAEPTGARALSFFSVAYKFLPTRLNPLFHHYRQADDLQAKRCPVKT